MERCKTRVVLSQDHVILTDNSRTLWCNRKTGTLTAGNAFHRDATLDYLDLGKVWGIVGKICFFPDGEWKLVVVTQASYLGELPHGGDVYCVDRIGIIPLTGGSTETIGLEPEAGLESTLTARPLSPVKTKEMREKEKVEKRLTDALLGMFNDSQSFYFCLNSDLTQSLQRRLDSPEEHQQLPLWERMDERFFWNKWMLSDLLDRKLNDLKLSTSWIFPLIQGYVELRQIPVLSKDMPTILRPGWSAQYREERERILRECEEEEEERGRREGPRREEGLEIEMEDMANVGRGESSMIPMQTFTGSGYVTDSEGSASDEEPVTEMVDFSPVKFTSEVAAGGSSSEAGNVRVIPAIKGTGGAAGLERETGSDVTGVGGSSAGQTGSGGKGGESAGVKRDESGSADQGVVESSQVHTDTLAELGPRQPISQDSGSTLQQDSESTLCASVVDDHTGQAEGEAQMDGGQSLGGGLPGAAGSLGGNEKGIEPSLAASVEETDRDNDMESSTTNTCFFRSEEMSDSEMEGAVLIDIIKSSETSSYSSPEKKAATSSEDTQGDSQNGVYEFPNDLEAVSPMGNPFLESERQEKKAVHTPYFTLAIISRRSCHRAGTRYKRRGVDSEGHVANYVETELVLRCGSHVVSYVIIRGSVPVYWSQPGNKYRPLPIIEKSEEETQQAFKKHFDMNLALFQEMVAVNLVKQTGREKLVADAFEKHVLLMNEPLLSYVAFDFHQSYKENQTLALQKLLDGTAEFIKRFKFCWIDTAQASYGPLCKQEGVFRVNCMDCLDRTNVVESLLSREVLQTSLQKLGMIPFDETLGGSTLVSYQEMWANNGDIVSKQYAGTAAMKGDITRYGERRIAGLMKDGYNSAHRYYLNVFRDSYRQVLIDLMQGVSPSEAFSSLSRFMQAMEDLDEGLLQSGTREPPPVDKTWTLERETAMAEMINVCRDELFPRLGDAPLSPNALYGWVLMEAAGYSFLGDSKEEEPCVVMHSAADAQLCVAKFNIESKKILCFLRVPTSQIQKMVIGPLGIIIRNSKRLHMRIHYSLSHDTSYYFTFTTANCISTAEDRAILVSIAELLAKSQPSIIVQEQKISKKKSLPHKGVIYLELPEGTSPFPLSSSGSAVSSYTSHDLDNFPKPKEKPVLNIEGRGSREDHKEEGGAEEEEEEEEPSLSAPSSPMLKSPLRQRWHHSCDDLLSSSTIAIPSPDPSQPPEAQPSITVTTPSTRKNVLVVPNLYQQELDESDDTSGSDLDLSDSEIESRLPTNLGTSNTLKDILKAPGTASDYAGDDEDDVELKNAEEDGNRRGEASSGKFSRLKGKFLRTVKHSTSSFLSRPRSRSPQPQETPSGEGAAPQVRRRSLSPTPVEGESSRGPPASQLQQVASTMKNRFKMNSPHLWKKARRPPPPVAPSEEEVLRARSCKSRIIYIT